MILIKVGCCLRIIIGKKKFLCEFEECVNIWIYLNIKKELLI